MHLGAEQLVRHRAADQRRGDVVEERRDHEHHHEQHERALPVGGQEARQHQRHAALLEMPRQEREAHEQQEEVGEDHPLVREVAQQPADARAFLESGERRSCRRVTAGSPVSATRQRVVVEERDARAA